MDIGKHPEHQYLKLLQDVLENGFEKQEFDGAITTKSVFGRQMRFDLSQGFPLLTTKKLHLREVIHELVWFLHGGTNIRYLIEHDVHLWDDWAYREYKKAVDQREVAHMSQKDFIERILTNDEFAKKWGELGPIYGRQWRRWPASDGREVDQLQWAIDKIKKSPDSRHAIVSSWNPEYVYEMARPTAISPIPPCHTMYNINVTDGKLSLLLYQRSADLVLGVPLNVATYALLTMVLAQVCGYEAGELIHVMGDTHIYSNHFEEANEQLKRAPRLFPMMHINPSKLHLSDFVYEDFTVEGYDPHAEILAEISVVSEEHGPEFVDYNQTQTALRSQKRWTQ